MTKDKLAQFFKKALEASFYVVIIGIPISNAITTIGITAAFVFWITKKVLARDFEVPPRGLALFFIAFIAWNALSFVNSGYPYESLRGLIKVLKFLGFFYIVYDTVRTREQFRRILFAILIMAGIMAVDGWIQYGTDYDVFRRHPIDKLDYLNRLTASFHDGNNFGGYLTLIIPIFVSLLLSRLLDKKRLLLTLIALGYLSFCLYGTQSRGAWIAFLVALLVLGGLKSRKVFIGLATALLILALIMPGSVADRFKNLVNMERSPTWERVQIWTGAVRMIKAHPILGSGVNTFARNFPKYRPADYPDNRYAHNCYLQMAAEIGAPGAGIFIIFLCLLIFSSVRFIRRMPQGWERTLSTGLLSGFVGYAFHSGVDTHLYSLVMATLFWFAAGILMSLKAMEGLMPEFKRILLVRTDRIGDLILNTPAIRAVRKRFPSGHITIIVNPYAQDVVRGNADIDEIIVYDPKQNGRGLFNTLKLTRTLNRRKFDLAIILNPSKLFNIVTYLAGIPTRVGYNRKWPFLLNKKIEDEKHLGEKHEVDYNLELVGLVGARTEDKRLHFQVEKGDEERIFRFLRNRGLKDEDALVAVHPATSDPLKRWGDEKFRELIDHLIQKLNVNVCLIGEKRGSESIFLAKPGSRKIDSDPIFLNLRGRLTLKELGALLKRCKLLISNDSGPVHIATAVGTPTVVIFARREENLTPKRWGPAGPGHTVIYDDLDRITVEKVFESARRKLITQMNTDST